MVNVNWPNRLTILRIILVPVFVMAILYHQLNLGLFVFFIASATDALDGYLARALNKKTQFGTIMDPIADKLLIDTAFICFSVVSSLPDYIQMPIYVPLIVISRDVIILLGVASIYLISGKLNVRPSALGKITSFFQMLTIIVLLLRFRYSNWIWNITVIFTLLSGIDYIRKGTKEINGVL
ncbi:CDP-alcohol phosphatidyltransferase [Candidatus Omnitrophus magneticus]|uniref:CDP-diacylglycerol--glycerol-3-phosphate 3-phosphatidyltransferase n=1 Tax=Candidatus Omnitrophus magneticus TaxID=1609969 RepID=A0A0F0CNZ9_9BACT|nr:CDP-alcohol phosphatidyltransferase [Candidatus Omnitrophus magneticus]